MAAVHEGGCLCGAIRYRVTGEPIRAQVCHCKFCQRRTGTAFAIVVAFKQEQIDLSGTTLADFEHRSDESNRWLRCHFCSRCGTTVSITGQRDSTIRMISAGTFDDPNWFKVDRHIWTRSALHWMTYPPGVETYEKAFLK